MGPTLRAEPIGSRLSRGLREAGPSTRLETDTRKRADLVDLFMQSSTSACRRGHTDGETIGIHRIVERGTERRPRAVRDNLDHDADVTVWDEGDDIFAPGTGTLEALFSALDRNRFDFAILVLTPDDLTLSRGTERLSARDNVLFKLGLFIGRLGRFRTFAIMNPDTLQRLPSDLRGVTVLQYKERSDENIRAALGLACDVNRRAMSRLGLLDQARARWHRVSAMAFKAIGFAADELRNGMEQLLTGKYLHFYNQPYPDELLNELRRELSAFESALAELRDWDHQERLGVLANSQRWVWLAEKGLDTLKHRHRATLAAWIALTMSSDEFAETIQEQAELNHLVSTLQITLRQLEGIDTHGTIGSRPRDRESILHRVYDLWDEVSYRTVRIHEGLQRRVGNVGWISARGRPCLTSERRQLLDGVQHSPPQ